MTQSHLNAFNDMLDDFSDEFGRANAKEGFDVKFLPTSVVNEKGIIEMPVSVPLGRCKLTRSDQYEIASISIRCKSWPYWLPFYKKVQARFHGISDVTLDGVSILSSIPVEKE